MRLADIQAVFGKSLETQNLVQQVVAHPDLMTRQIEMSLSVERERQQSSVSAGSASTEGEAAHLPMESSLPQTDRRKRYRLVFQPGQGPVLESSGPSEVRSSHFDVRI